jgi:hypothetical protein
MGMTPKMWRINRAEPQPDWTHIGGDLNLDVQCFPDGHWLVLEDGKEHVMFLSPEQHAAWEAEQ